MNYKLCLFCTVCLLSLGTSAIKEAKQSVSWSKLESSAKFAQISQLQRAGVPQLIEHVPIATDTQLKNAIINLLISSSLKVKSNPALQLLYSDHTLPWASKYKIQPQFNYIPIDAYLSSLNESLTSFPFPRMNALLAVCGTVHEHSLSNYCHHYYHKHHHTEFTHPHNNNTYLYGALYIDRPTVDSFSPGLRDMLTATNKLQDTKLHLLVQSPGMQVTMHYDAKELFILQLTGELHPCTCLLPHHVHIIILHDRN